MWGWKEIREERERLSQLIGDITYHLSSPEPNILDTMERTLHQARLKNLANKISLCPSARLSDLLKHPFLNLLFLLDSLAHSDQPQRHLVQLCYIIVVWFLTHASRHAPLYFIPLFLSSHLSAGSIAACSSVAIWLSACWVTGLSYKQLEIQALSGPRLSYQSFLSSFSACLSEAKRSFFQSKIQSFFSSIFPLWGCIVSSSLSFSMWVYVVGQ